MTVVVICIFILTSAIFLCYDYLVNHRQTAIMSFATKSGRIVDSLFPANVKERLFDNAAHLDKHLDADPDATAGEDGSEIHPQARRDSDNSKTKFDKMKALMNRGSRRDLAPANSEALVNFGTPPIADLFHETSIMFADIVGFTEWSSNHSPEEVFHLLETLFLEFDRIAARMNVFKLGTIGDCYIAVTGIPDLRPDHAVVLCQFTEECRLKMHDVIDQLQHIFTGVTALSMRFGIHSGPVTGGVLRGPKSRFELFGDTINTASRMESNGIPGQIQLSQQTADLLIGAGHQDWLKPRKGLVHAKGKGDMQTYWLILDEDSNKVDETDAESPLFVSNNKEGSHHLFYQNGIETLSRGSSSSSLSLG